MFLPLSQLRLHAPLHPAVLLIQDSVRRKKFCSLRKDGEQMKKRLDMISMSTFAHLEVVIRVKANKSGEMVEGATSFAAGGGCVGRLIS
eukprot:2592159-Rhodomonas_salina.3